MPFAQARAHMPKFLGLLACGSAAFLADSQAARFYRSLSTADENIVEPANPFPVGSSNAIHSELILKQNSAVVASNIYRLRVQQADFEAEVACEDR